MTMRAQGIMSVPLQAGTVGLQAATIPGTAATQFDMTAMMNMIMMMMMMMIMVKVMGKVTV